jgi:para-nitrobenzyl esterase
MGERIVELPGGDVRVHEDSGIMQARGLRYARVRRFAECVRVSSWEGVLDATQTGPACPQAEFRLAMVTGPIMASSSFDEDCLTVSVTAPSPDGRTRPVMVWFHGGAYISGSGGAPVYDATRLVAEGDVVVVTVNYRLGILGYLAIDGVAPANLGLLDQIEALRWIAGNIAAFGGDPNNVTLFGQSAGGDSIACLMAADGVVGLFRRAILQSAPLGVRFGRAAMSKAVSEAAGAALPDNPQRAPIAAILDAQRTAGAAAQAFGIKGLMAFGPELGHFPLPPEVDVEDRWDEAAKRIDVIIGWTRHDARPFLDLSVRLAPLVNRRWIGTLVRKTLTTWVTATVFGRPAHRFARRHRNAGGRAEAYRFDWAPPHSPLGACHCIELPFLLGAPRTWDAAPMLKGASQSALATIGPALRERWTRFAHNGFDANPPPLPRSGRSTVHRLP